MCRGCTCSREHPAFFQIIQFLHFFLFFWFIFALLDPDPDPADQNQCWSTRIQIRTPRMNGTVSNSYQIDIKSGTWSVDSLLSKSSNVSRVYLFQRTSSISNHPIFTSFFYFSGSFLPFWIRIRIRIQPTKINVDPRWSGSEHLVWTVSFSYQMDINPAPEAWIRSCLRARMWCRSICSREHPAFQIIKFLHFFYFFLFIHSMLIHADPEIPYERYWLVIDSYENRHLKRGFTLVQELECVAGVLVLENIQHFKSSNFDFFLLFWFIFALLDPDPDPADQNQCWSTRIRIRTPLMNGTVSYSYQIDIKSGTWSVDSLLSKSSNVSRVYLFQSRVSTSSGTLNTSLATATILPEAIQNNNF